MVHLTRIYTRTGDSGQTRLTDNSLTSKTDSRMDAYGQVDELNSAIGVVIAQEALETEARKVLQSVQNDLFDLGADLSNPVIPDPKQEPLRIIAEDIERLERWCDCFGADLPPLHSFILPGGSQTSALLHVCRTTARRAERAAWRAAEEYGVEDEVADSEGGINPLAIRYLNRLSDLMFILSRRANVHEGVNEVLWVPGGERNPNAGH